MSIFAGVSYKSGYNLLYIIIFDDRAEMLSKSSITCYDREEAAERLFYFIRSFYHEHEDSLVIAIDDELLYHATDERFSVYEDVSCIIAEEFDKFNGILNAIISDTDCFFRDAFFCSIFAVFNSG